MHWDLCGMANADILRWRLNCEGRLSRKLVAFKREIDKFVPSFFLHKRVRFAQTFFTQSPKLNNIYTMEPRIINTHFAKMHKYRYVGKGVFIYEGLVCSNSSIKSVKEVTINELNDEMTPVKYNGSFIDIIPQ